jgi:hypothetical protein
MIGQRTIFVDSGASVMTGSVERRSQIDTETYKGLLVINGGGAVALLSFLAAILNRPNVSPLVHAVLWGVILLMFGLALAVMHNHLRRRCDLTYELHDGKPRRGQLFGFNLREPMVCCCSWACMWLSLGAFVIAALIVAVTGLSTL